MLAIKGLTASSAWAGLNCPKPKSADINSIKIFFKNNFLMLLNLYLSYFKVTRGANGTRTLTPQITILSTKMDTNNLIGSSGMRHP